MITNKRQLRAAISDEKATLTDKEVFTSDAFKNFAESLCKGVGKIYEVPTFSINAYWGGTNDDMTACVDGGCRFTVNLNNSIVQGLSRKERFACLIGTLCHEVSHRLWSNFMELEYICDCIMSGKIIQRYQARAINEYLANFPNQKDAVAKIFKHLSNIIEDGYIEERFKNTYLGFRKYLVANRNVLCKSDIAGMQTYGSQGTINDILNLSLLYAVDKHSSSELGCDEARECMDIITPRIDEALVEHDSKERLTKVLNILNEILIFLEKKEEEKKNQQQQSGNSGDSQNSDSSNSDSSDGNGSSNNSNESGDSSNTNPANGDSDSDSSDNGDSNDNDSSSDSNTDSDNSGSDGSSNSSSNDSNSDDENSSTDSNNGTDGSDSADAIPSMNSDLGLDDAADNIGSNTSVDVGNETFAPLDNSTNVSENPSNSNTPANSDFDNELDKLEDDIANEKVEEANEKEIQEKRNTLKNNMDFSDFHRGVHSSVIRIPKQAAPSDWDEINAEANTILKRLVKEWAKQIHDLQIGQNLNGLYSGRRLTQAYRTDLKRFSSKKAPSDIPDMSLCLLVDLSGSMRGNSIRAARKAALLTYKFCKELDIRFACVGHQVSCGNVKLTSFADFDSIDGNDELRIAAIDGYAGGCNRDGYALRYCEELLKNEQSSQKILLIISDGAPNDDDYGFYYMDEKPSDYQLEQSGNAKLDILDIEKNCAKEGISIIAAGIEEECGAIKDLYTYGVSKKCAPNFLEISDLSKMPKKFIEILKKEIEKQG